MATATISKLTGIPSGTVDNGASAPVLVNVQNEVEVKNDTGNPLSTEPLGIPAFARQLAAGATSANTALTTTCRRASIYARNADIRYSVGTTPQTASATSHFIASGERLDIALPPNANIAVIRDGSTDGILCVSELA